MLDSIQSGRFCVKTKTIAAMAALVTFLVLAIATSCPAHAQTLTVLYSFAAGGDGAMPLAGVTIDRGGNLYGTTCEAGTGNGGTVYQLRKRSNGDWMLNAIHEFMPQNGDGRCPQGRAV